MVDKKIGNTIRNDYRIYSNEELIEIQETISPDLVVEKFLGKNHLFISALAITLTKNFGDIQFCYSNKQVKNSEIEIVVYYSHNEEIIDKDTRERMIFFHVQQSLDFNYIETEKLLADSNSYFSLTNTN